MFYSRLQDACANNATTPTAVAQKFGMSSGNVTRWKNGGFPSVEVLVKISEYLNVSVDFLLTGKATATLSPNSVVKNSNIAQHNSSIIIGSKELSSEESELIEEYRKLKFKDKAEVMALIANKSDQ